MKRTTGTFLIVVLAFMVTGCGDASAPSDSIASSGDSLASGPSGHSREQPVSSPSDTVAQFYEALRGGEEDTIANLLTDKARSETAKAGLDIQSQGSADLEYQLGEVDYINESLDGAHVKSLWIDYTPEGDKVATEVIWVLRKQAEGWRIAGMATQVAEGQLPLLFNFENPQDMLQKKEFVESQYGQTDEAEVQQTASPEGTVASDQLVR